MTSWEDLSLLLVLDSWRKPAAVAGNLRLRVDKKNLYMSNELMDSDHFCMFLPLVFGFWVWMLGVMLGLKR